MDETAEDLLSPVAYFFLACKVTPEASPTMGLIDKRVPAVRYPGTHPPCTVAGSCGPRSSIIPTRKRSKGALSNLHPLPPVHAHGTIRRFAIEFPLRSYRIVSVSVQLNSNARAAIIVDNGQAVLVRTGDCRLSGCCFRGLFMHGS